MYERNIGTEPIRELLCLGSKLKIFHLLFQMLINGKSTILKNLYEVDRKKSIFLRQIMGFYENHLKHCNSRPGDDRFSDHTPKI